MALAKQFSNKLDRLWARRTARLRALVIPRGRGAAPKFTRRIRERLINGLLDDAAKILLKREGEAELRSVTRSRHLTFVKGRGRLERGSRFLSWAETKLRGPIVYSFWKGKRCLYVGKGSSWKRLRSYEKSTYLHPGHTVEVLCVGSDSQLGKAECLATHLFRPMDRKVKPAKVKWGKACPICRKHDDIHAELKALFRMK